MHFLMSEELAKQYTMKGKPHGELAPRRAFDQTRTYEVLVVALTRNPNDVELNDVKNMLDVFLRNKKAETENKKKKTRRSQMDECDTFILTPTKRQKSATTEVASITTTHEILVNDTSGRRLAKDKNELFGDDDQLLFSDDQHEDESENEEWMINMKTN